MHIIKHFLTITKHRHKVMHYCFKCGLYKQGLLHDLSKYSFIEFFNGAKYYDGTKSPHHNERLTKGYSDAWMHHKGRNKHHSEYWYDWSNIEKRYVPIPMPNKYIGEMFCDRLAASKVYNKKNFTPDIPLNYYLSKQHEVIMHEDTKQKIEFLLRMYQSEGEKKTFKYIKKHFRKEKK